MNWLLVGSTCHSIIDFSWLIGALAGVVLDSFLIIAIALTPPLREHGGAPPPMGAMQRYGLWLPPLLIAVLWLTGLSHVKHGLLACYAALTASAAAIVVAIAIVPIVYIAAHHIARRSVP